MPATASDLRVAIAQLNPTVGDFEGNARQIAATARRAAAAGADVLLTPEMSLIGYPAEDWLLREDFCAAAFRQLRRLAQDIADLQLVTLVGTVMSEPGGARRFNALCALRGGEILATGHKRHLPDYGVFDETRIFAPGSETTVIEVGGVRVGLCLCEDLWYEDVAAEARRAGAEILLSANASPYEVGKRGRREAIVLRHVAGLPLIYANCVGGQDELVFDGASFAADAAGQVVTRLPSFSEDFAIISLARLSAGAAEARATDDGPEELLSALILAVGDYVRKNGFSEVMLGLSGGVDSAVVAAIATAALGPERVRALMMPTRFTAELSLSGAARIAGNLGLDYRVIPIEGILDKYLEALAQDFAGRPWDVTEENLQARIRGAILMAEANKFGRLVLTTGNKSELAVGYCTVYGDTAGAFAPLKDVFKTAVWELARLINARAGREIIPEEIISRPPSAELRADQRDEDSLPPYHELDRILRRYIEGRLDAAAIAAETGAAPETIARVISLVHRAEYKRRQGPPGPKVSPLAFGRDWRFPISAKRFYP